MRLFEIESLSKDAYLGDEFSVDDDEYALDGLDHAEKLLKRAHPAPGYKGIFWVWNNGITLLVPDYKYSDTLTAPAIIGKFSVYPVNNYRISEIRERKPIYRVGSIAVQKNYRGRGLGTLMYLLILKKGILEAGEEQTPDGRRAWLRLSQTPGVEVNGLLKISSKEFDGSLGYTDKDFDKLMDALMSAGFYHIGKDISHDREIFLYPIEVGKKQLKSVVDKVKFRLYSDYGSEDNHDFNYIMTLIAKWTGS